ELLDRYPVELRPERPADVHVLERSVLGVDPDVVVARPRRERDLRRIALVGELYGRLRGGVELDGVRALQDLLPDHGGIAADVDVDLVEVRGRPERRGVRVRIPVRIAYQRQRLPGLVADAGELARLVVLDQVRAGRHQVLRAVRRRALLVQRAREL